MTHVKCSVVITGDLVKQCDASKFNELFCKFVEERFGKDNLVEVSTHEQEVISIPQHKVIRKCGNTGYGQYYNCPGGDWKQHIEVED